MNPEQPQDTTDQGQEPSEAQDIATYMAETDAKIQELATKLHKLGTLTIQAIMELEDAMGQDSEKKTGELRGELSMVRRQLNDIIEE